MRGIPLEERKALGALLGMWLGNHFRKPE